MIDYQSFKLLHHHADTWVSMEPREAHDSAERDPERALIRHGVVYRCTACDEEVLVEPPEGSREPF